MVLKSLEIQGFKSFPDKTKITFGKGLTAVVGPNGSGKSNISDAVRWVMGEQSTKNLRGAKMEDVIFTGTQSRKSQGFAEVSLVIDNADQTLPIEQEEVTITRKYYRSGESEYMINRSMVRLRDIHELFMDTGLGKDGYALVGQGRIAEIVRSKSDERREIFEEAAGISKYRYRKQEAEKKLDSAEENLLRLKDIYQELEDRVIPLREQSEKARQFLELAERRKALEISSWLYTLEQSNLKLKDQSDKILARRLQHEELEQQMNATEAEIQTIHQTMQQCLVEIDGLRRRKEELEQQTSGIYAAIAVCNNDIQHNRQNQQRIQLEMESLLQSKEQNTEELTEKQNAFKRLQNRLEQLEQVMARQEQELKTIAQKETAFSETAMEFTRRINELLLKQSQNKLDYMQLMTQKEEANQHFKNNKSLLQQKRVDIHHNQEELKHTEEFLYSLEQRSQELQNRLNGYQMKYHSRQKEYAGLEEQSRKNQLQIQEKQQKAKLLQDLEQNLEGFAYSVKAVLNRGKQGNLAGILGTVSQLLEVSDSYSTAIETALGGSLQNLIVEDEESAKSAIRFLQREHAGRATFLPLTSVKGTQMQTASFERESGYVGLAAKLVNCDVRFQGIIDFLLGRIVIAEDLDAAVEIAKKNQYRFRIVTLDGQVVNTGGSLSGGSQNKAQGFLSRKADIQRLKQESGRLQEDAKRLRQSMQKQEQALSVLQSEMGRMNQEAVTLKEDRIRCEGEQKRLSQLIAQESKLLEQMEQELKEHEKRSSSRESQAEVLRQEQQQTETQLELARAELLKVQGESTAFLQQKEKLSEQLTENRYQKLEIQKDIEVLKHNMLELERRSDSSKEQVSRLHREYEGLEKENSDISQKIVNYQQEIEKNGQDGVQLEKQVVEKMEERNQLETKTTGLRQQERERMVQKERLSQELARFEERQQSIQKDYDLVIARLWEEYQLTRGEAQQLALEVEDIDQMNRELTVIKGRIKALGNVNVAAIEEYQEVFERYQFLKEQLEDVEQSRQELLRLIADLTAQMREIFAENFEKINRHFQQIFVDLFGGGKAELKLTDPSDILNCGIEIFVEPPGKIIKNLSLLSGGEQAFVAIAIYFAIIKVRPAPFCILDEIEAALDDVNVSKYAAYLRSMSGKTQFIMITHRRGTMEEADVLYGVTMQEEGVSKLLQLKISEVEAQMANALK